MRAHLGGGQHRQSAGPVPHLPRQLGLEQDHGDGVITQPSLHSHDQLIDVKHQLLVPDHAHCAGQAQSVTSTTQGIQGLVRLQVPEIILRKTKC